MKYLLYSANLQLEWKCGWTTLRKSYTIREKLIRLRVFYAEDVIFCLRCDLWKEIIPINIVRSQ